MTHKKAAAACGSIWILGGETSEVFKYRPSTDEWSQMAITLPNHVITTLEPYFSIIKNLDKSLRNDDSQ